MAQKDARVAVVMSSFNGARYIEEQVDSILQQTGVDVSLFIRDDGSTDETPRILKKYASDQRVTVVCGQNIGIGKSFMELLYSIPGNYEYYAFSDQDDIWDKDKLLTAVRRLGSETGCALYACNLQCVDAVNRSIGVRFGPDMLFDGSLFSIILASICYGCTQVFNQALLSLLRCARPSDRFLENWLHDTWVAVSAAATGTVIFDWTPHIRYRRHDGNYTIFDCSKATIWKRRFEKLVFRSRRKPRSWVAEETIRHYPEWVEKDPDRDLIYLFAHPRTIANKIALIRLRKRFIAYTNDSGIWFAAKVMIGVV